MANAASAAPKTGWALLHSNLPPKAFTALDKSVYGVGGLSDINEAYLIQRLHASGLRWEEEVVKSEYLGFEDRTPRGKDYTNRWYLAQVTMYLTVDGRRFVGTGAHDNMKLDAAFKGAKTVAFKNACKSIGMTIELYMSGRAMDFIYHDRDGAVAPGQTGEIKPENATPEAQAIIAAGGAPEPEVRAQVAEKPSAVAPSSQTFVDGDAVRVITTSDRRGVTAQTVEKVATTDTSQGRARRGVGPTAKRTNVIQMTPPTTAPSEDDGLPLDAPYILEEPEPSVVLYRGLVRETAARLWYLRVVHNNHKGALLGNEPKALPSESEASPDSDKALAMYLGQVGHKEGLDALILPELETVNASLEEYIVELGKFVAKQAEMAANV